MVNIAILNKDPIIWRKKMNLFDKNFSFLILKFSLGSSYMYVNIVRMQPTGRVNIRIQNNVILRQPNSKVLKERSTNAAKINIALMYPNKLKMLKL